MREIEVPDIPLRQIVWWTVGVLAVAVFFWLILRFQNVLIWLLAAIILSIGLDRLVRRAGKIGIPRPLTLLLIFALLVLLILLFLWFALPTVTSQGTAISATLGEGYTLLLDQLKQMDNIVLHRVLLVLPDNLPGLIQAAGDSAETTAEVDLSTILSQSRALFQSVFAIISVVLLAVFWTLDGEHIRRKAMLLVPIEKRGEVREVLEDINHRLGSYLVGQAILCLSIGTLALIAYLLIGLPNALILAIFAGFMEAIPVVGPIISTIPAVIIGLTISPTTALWVVIAMAIIQQLENNLLVPRVMKRAIGVSPLVTILALLGFGSLFGILGALVALPVAAVVQLLLDRYLLAGEMEEVADEGRDRLSRMRYDTNELVSDLRGYIRHKVSEPSAQADALEDELEAIALELESFLASQEQAAQ
ncbi:MAG: AI-2E family transporter [Candidatus Promineifilaceae bacterium]